LQFHDSNATEIRVEPVQPVVLLLSSAIWLSTAASRWGRSW
jgi:hypothetical protein